MRLYCYLIIALILWLTSCSTNKSESFDVKKSYRKGFYAGFQHALEQFADTTRVIYYTADSLVCCEFDTVKGILAGIQIDSALSNTIIYGFTINFEGVQEINKPWKAPPNFPDTVFEGVTDEQLIRLGFTPIPNHSQFIVNENWSKLK